MKKLSNSLMLILGFVAVFLVLLVVTLTSSRNEKITSNPQGTIGNTAGNINNSGLFAESNGMVYFSNSYDNGSLYSMTLNEENITKLTSVNACNLLVGGDYLYYFQYGASGATGLGNVRTPHSFNRCHLDGSHQTSLTREVIVAAQLVNDTLFMQGQKDTAYFFRMQTDKSDRVDLANYILNPAAVSGNYIYYNGTVNDHYLYALDVNSGVATEILRENMWYPVVNGEYVYYMDTDNDYQLRRYSMSQNTIEILTKEKVESFNVGGGYIYYQTMGKDPHLAMMRTDGSDNYVLSSGYYMDINMTSTHVYFRDYFNDTTIYHAYIGNPYFEAFTAAKEVVGLKK